jgi:hypothetical protein
MATVPIQVKRHPVLTAVLAWILVMTPVGMTAEAAFHLDHTYEPSHGMDLFPDVQGLHTQPPQALPAPVRASGHSVVVQVHFKPGGDFWRALANCESPDGRSGRYLGYFQFHPNTWQATGGGDLGSYEHQKTRAQQWAAKVDPGSTAGWPVCWWRAKRATGG